MECRDCLVKGRQYGAPIPCHLGLFAHSLVRKYLDGDFNGASVCGCVFISEEMFMSNLREGIQLCSYKQRLIRAVESYVRM